MLLNIKDKKDCAFDMLALGEVMLRFDPGDTRIRTARSFKVWEGGGEYNAARGLRRCFGLKTGVLTALADNDVGRLVEDLILQGGVDISFIKWLPFDGIGREVRNGLNFTERGFGIRGASGMSDRGNTAASQLTPDSFDFDFIFGELGVRWFHTGGIFAALSESTARTVKSAVQAAKKHGTTVSYDLNYRPSLWKSIGGIERAREVNSALAPYVDVMIGNEEDFTACLDFKVEGNDENLKELNLEGYIKMLGEVTKRYPNLKVIANTLRTVKTATFNDWSAIAYAGGRIYNGLLLPALEIYDRVGGGDSFASGLIYGLMTFGDVQKALDYGIAHGALAMTTPGDTSTATLSEVESIVNGESARIVR